MPMSCRWAAHCVTADLARTLAAPLSAAERIKTLYGAALGDIESGTDVVAVPQMGEDGDDVSPCACRAPC
jgi:cell division protein FtsA